MVIPNMTSTSLPLIKLQWYQELHDKYFHRDVWVMSNMKRLSHLSSHLVKYTQGMSQPNTWIDMLACTLSIANTFNLSFTRMYVRLGYHAQCIRDVPFTFNNSLEILESEMKNVLQRIAKLVEGWDHIETIQHRQELENILPKLLSLICQRALLADPELTLREFYGAYFDRLTGIQSNHMFYVFHRELMEQSPTYLTVVEFFKPPIKTSIGTVMQKPQLPANIQEGNYNPLDPNTQGISPQGVNMNTSLSGAELDTLYQLVLNGPLSAGNLPSKVGFADLSKRALATQYIADRLHYVTEAGLEHFKSLTWGGVLGEQIVNANYKS